MSDKQKIVEGNFIVNFTTENVNELPAASQMNSDIQELFAATLDQYLYNKKIEGLEVHLVLCDDFTIEDKEED